MVDETKSTEIAAPAVVTAAPVPTPEISTSPAATSEVIPQAVVSTEKPADAPIEAVKPADAVKPEPENVLGVEPEKKAETKEGVKDAKPTDAKPEGEKPLEAAKTELPKYDEFKLPENTNLQLAKEPLEAFTKILGEIETGKLDHKTIQEKGQALIDLAAKNTVESIERYTDSLVESHKANITNRVKALKADPDLGGDNFENTMSTLQASVAEYGGSVQQIAEFRKEITESGLGASPAVCRLIYNMQQKINKYTTEGDGNRLVPGAKPAPVKVKPYESFYSGNRA